MARPYSTWLQYARYMFKFTSCQTVVQSGCSIDMATNGVWELRLLHIPTGTC